MTLPTELQGSTLWIPPTDPSLKNMMPCLDFEGQPTVKAAEPASPRQRPIMVVGFYFTPYPTTCEVLLIKKRRSRVPQHVGKLNGLGGGIELGDGSVASAMSREFREETGHDVPVERWFLEGSLSSYKDSDRWDLYILTAVGDKFTPATIATEEGTMHWVPVAKLHEYDVVENLRWMIPMLLDRTNHGLSLTCHFFGSQRPEPPSAYERSAP